MSQLPQPSQRLHFNLALEIPQSSSNQVVSAPQQNFQNVKDANARNIIALLYGQWRSNIIAVERSLQEMDGSISITTLQENEKRLNLKVLPEPVKVELGDRVKIRMKQRQMKQISKAGWNNAIKYDYDRIGSVIGIHAPDAAYIVVYFKHSNQRWTLNARSLEKVEETPQPTDHHVKVGDCVQIDDKVPDCVISTMQDLISMPVRTVLNYRYALQKLVAFTRDDVAIVSIDPYKSIYVNVGLLSIASKANKVADAPFFLKKYAIGKQYKVKSDIANMIFLPLWSVSHTKILDGLATICYHGQNGQLGIKVDGNGYLITVDYLGKKCTKNDKRQRKRTGGEQPYELTQAFPFLVDDVLQLSLGSPEKTRRLLKDVRVPESFIEVIEDECGTFVGYDALGLAHVEFQLPVNNRSVNQKIIFALPVDFLKFASENEGNSHFHILNRMNALKVESRVSLITARHCKFTKEELHKVFATRRIHQAMTTNATLIAFDDNNDLAILKFDDGKTFTCPSNCISLPQDELDDQFTDLSLDRLPVPASGDHQIRTENSHELPQLQSSLIAEPRADVVEESQPEEETSDEDREAFPPPIANSSFAPPETSNVPQTPPVNADAHTIEKPATISFNTTTKDIIVKGNLGVAPQLAGSRVVPSLSRQNSSLPAHNEDDGAAVVGGTLENFICNNNFNNCLFFGPTSIGNNSEGS